MFLLALAAILFIIGVGTLGGALFGRLRRRRLWLLLITIVMWSIAAYLFILSQPEELEKQATPPPPTLVPTATVASAPAPATSAPTSTPAPTSAPAPDVAQGHIMFASQRGGNFDIWEMDLADPKDLVQLTTDPANDVEPRLSPDGSHILFSSTRENANGVNDIWVMDADGANPKRLLAWPDSYEWGAAWSPDGKWIAFVTTRDGKYEIYLLPADAAMSGDKAEPINLTQNDFLDSYPDWSPDGRWLVFVSDRSGNWDMWKMDVQACLAARQESKGQATTPGAAEDPRCQATQLTDNYEDDLNPRWSPDGSQIAFESRREANRDVYVIDADGGNVRRITTALDRDSAPFWVANGRALVYSNEAKFDFNLHLISLDDGNDRQLTDFKGEDRYGDWKP